MWAGAAALAGLAVFSYPAQHTYPGQNQFDKEDELESMLTEMVAAPELNEDAVRVNLETLGDKITHFNIKRGQQVRVEYESNRTVPPMYRVNLVKNTCKDNIGYEVNDFSDIYLRDQSGRKGAPGTQTHTFVAPYDEG